MLASPDAICLDLCPKKPIITEGPYLALFFRGPNRCDGFGRTLTSVSFIKQAVTASKRSVEGIWYLHQRLSF